jgi:hypothetical protein
MALTSSFAGIYSALEYAYGVASGAPPLEVAIGNSAAGAGTITLVTGQVNLSNGTVISPITTLTPITVGIGANAETVTPSAVTVANLGTAGPGVGAITITATFANVHGPQEPVSSGTFGLQEAINAASAAGGGVVAVSGRWAALGGTSTILAAATFPTNGTVGIADNRSGAGAVQTKTVLVTNAEVKTLFSVGKTLLPAPGTTSAYDILDIVIENVFLTAAFAAGGAIQASYGTGVTTPASATIASTFLTSPAASQMIKVSGALASSLSSAVLNKAIVLAAATSDFTTGSGSLIVTITYRVLTSL